MKLAKLLLEQLKSTKTQDSWPHQLEKKFPQFFLEINQKLFSQMSFLLSYFFGEIQITNL